MDQERLQTFLNKREEWFSWYSVAPDEPNSIQYQIHLMLYTEMAYRVALAEHRREHTALAGLPIIGYLLEGGYFATQVMAVRRLLDKRPDVHSMARILNELQGQRSLLTRDIFLGWDGTPYDPRYPEEFTPGFQQAGSPVVQFTESMRRHRLFDRLARKRPQERLPTDQIHQDVFDRLHSWMESKASVDLKRIRDKYFAHAADKKSRGEFELRGIDYIEVEEAQKTIVQTARVVFDLMLRSGIFSPVVMDNPLGWFGQVWEGGNLIASTSRMNQAWDELEKVRNGWQMEAEEALFDGLTPN